MSISLAESPLAPDYDRSAMSTGIVHIGVGGFHRAHEAACLDSLMRRRAGSAAPEAACLDWGICGVGLLPGDTRMRDALAGQGHLYTLTASTPAGCATRRSSARSTTTSSPPTTLRRSCPA